MKIYYHKYLQCQPFDIIIDSRHSDGLNKGEIMNIIEHVDNLNKINTQIAELKQIKEDLERIVISALGRANYVDGKMHDIIHDGQKSHEIGVYKVEISTDYNYKINKSEYEIYKSHLPKEFDPVISEVKYRINKKVFNSINVYGSDEQKIIRDKFITMEPAKPSVKIRTNV